MDPAALAGVCALLLRDHAPPTALGSAGCPTAVAPAAAPDLARLRLLVDQGGAREGIARVAYAEAGNQGDSGLAGVVYTILNRLADGRWGPTVDAVLNARSQFEPVMRAGGDWRALAPVSAAAQARIDTILNLALDGRLPDLTGGARFFQNPTVVAARARAGEVSPALVDFGGAVPSAVIGAHRFYAAAGPGARPGRRSAAPAQTHARDDLFVGENRAASAPVKGAAAAPGGVTGDPSQALFVRADGHVAAVETAADGR
ncbi:MAG TPA: cell wall hydrolase [Caulobacteraceae bacterium]|nr:cell wall hydrolase [Caulobacteraceae bacterium]